MTDVQAVSSPSPQDGRLLTADELSERLGVGKSTIFRMAKKNLIPSVPWGAELSCRRFDEQAVREKLATMTKPLRTYYPPKGKREAGLVEA